MEKGKLKRLKNTVLGLDYGETAGNSCCSEIQYLFFGWIFPREQKTRFSLT